jgi:integrase
MGHGYVQRVRAEKRLKAKDIDRLPAGVHEDGGGLRLVVEESGARRWVLRVTIAGKRHNRGLGPFPLVTLDAARDRAIDMRRAAREGRDLAQERRQQVARATTFRQAFDVMFDLRQQGLSNAKHLKQWPATMETYVFPRIGSRPVGDVTHADILEVLEPIWYEKPETAKRVLQRIEAVFKSAILRGQRDKASPCIGVAQELGVRHRDIEHHRALPYAELPAFIKRLHACPSEPATKLAFEWLILTATRSGETRGALWSEIDEAKALWTIPKQRMKANVEHVVPLSRRCLEVAKQARALNPLSDLLFPGSRTGKELSDMTLTKLLRDNGQADRATAHGFRSSFRDWCTEVDKTREVVAEAALAHQVRDKAEAAYRRAAYLDERVQLMARWAAYCITSTI